VCVCVCVYCVCMRAYKTTYMACSRSTRVLSNLLLQLDGLVTEFSKHSGEADLRWEEATPELLRELQKTKNQLADRAQQVCGGFWKGVRDKKVGSGRVGCVMAGVKVSACVWCVYVCTYVCVLFL